MQEQKLHYWKNKKTFKRSDEADNRHFSPMGLVRMRAAMQRYIDSGWAPGIVTLVPLRAGARGGDGNHGLQQQCIYEARYDFSACVHDKAHYSCRGNDVD